MRRGVGLLVLGVVAAALGVDSARAEGIGTTTTTGSTTTATTTTTTTPSYAPLPSSSLPAACVGAGAAAVVFSANSVVALGTPASDRGPSGSSYASSGTVVAFGSSTASGSTCTSAGVTLSSVSLFDGVVSASSVQATDGKGTVAGLEIDGAAVASTPGETLSVDGWGQLTLGATVGRVTAPLVLRLVQAHDSLPAGTLVAVAFAASGSPVASPKPKHHQHASRPSKRTGTSDHSTPQRRQPGSTAPPEKPPPDFPASPSPLLAGGHLSPAARDNKVVSLAVQYLGVPYRWGGASPKTGFDCSGLVSYVFGQLGVSLPHYTVSQYHSPDAVWVSPSRLKPGDLVFFVGSDGTRKAPGHVGIYVGDGYIIDAPHTGSFVRIDSLDARWYTDKYVGAKRIVASLQPRHLLHSTKAKRAVTVQTLPLFLPRQMTARISGGSLPGIAAVPTAAHASVTRNYGLWTGGGLGGALLLLLAGAAPYRRRRRTPAADAPTDDTNSPERPAPSSL